MNLHAVHHYTIWFEKEDGAVIPANLDDPNDAPPVDLYPYLVCRFPLMVETIHYRRHPDGMDEAVARAVSTANEELVVALINGGAERSFLQRVIRGVPRPPKIPLHEAIVIASEACGRCLHALAHRYGLPWGCPEGGPEWCRINTECAMCRGKWIPVR